MTKSYINSYNADGTLLKKSMIVKIQRRPKGYIKSAYKVLLDDGSIVIAPNAHILNGWIVDGGI